MQAHDAVDLVDEQHDGILSDRGRARGGLTCLRSGRSHVGGSTGPGRRDRTSPLDHERGRWIEIADRDGEVGPCSLPRCETCSGAAVAF